LVSLANAYILKKPNQKKKNITVQDIANVVGISASSVSRALNDHPKISQTTKNKVWASAKELGYKSTVPAFMTPSKTKTICFLLPDLQSGLYRDAIATAQKIAKSKGYSVLIAASQNSPELEKMYIRSLIDQLVQGVIIVNTNADVNAKSFQIFRDENIPTVFINKSSSDSKSCEIIPDVSHGAYLAVSHFISMKCKNIAVFTGDLSDIFYADMVNGYTDAMSESGLEMAATNVFSNCLSPLDIQNCLNELAKKNELPDAILAPNPNVSLAVVHWLKKHKKRVPEDLVLVSFSDGSDLSMVNFSLSIVAFSGTEIGQKAAEKLLQQIENDEISTEKIIVPAKFIIKASSLKIKANL
jgi:LacI family transcriptional regulator